MCRDVECLKMEYRRSAPFARPLSKPLVRGWVFEGRHSDTRFGKDGNRGGFWAKQLFASLFRERIWYRIARRGSRDAVSRVKMGLQLFLLRCQRVTSRKGKAI